VSSTTSANETLAIAASVLQAVGRNDPDTIDTAAALHCLHAAESLRAAGAAVRPMQIDADAAALSIRAALRRLSTLQVDDFARPAVLDAAAAARRALEIIERDR
jgi:hypothetical protein